MGGLSGRNRTVPFHGNDTTPLALALDLNMHVYGHRNSLQWAIRCMGYGIVNFSEPSRDSNEGVEIEAAFHGVQHGCPTCNRVGPHRERLCHREIIPWIIDPDFATMVK